jgi:hypothetical protein
MKDLEEICDKYRKLSNYFDQNSVSKSLSQGLCSFLYIIRVIHFFVAMQKVAMLENQRKEFVVLLFISLIKF